MNIPDKTTALILLFLEQGNSHLSLRAKSLDFKEVSAKELVPTGNKYREYFLQNRNK